HSKRQHCDLPEELNLGGDGLAAGIFADIGGKFRHISNTKHLQENSKIRAFNLEERADLLYRIQHCAELSNNPRTKQNSRRNTDINSVFCFSSLKLQRNQCRTYTDGRCFLYGHLLPPSPRHFIYSYRANRRLMVSNRS